MPATKVGSFGIQDFIPLKFSVRISGVTGPSIVLRAIVFAAIKYPDQRRNNTFDLVLAVLQSVKSVSRVELFVLNESRSCCFSVMVNLFSSMGTPSKISLVEVTTLALYSMFEDNDCGNAGGGPSSYAQPRTVIIL